MHRSDEMADNNNPKTESHDPGRRNFLKNTGLVVGGVAGGSLLGGLFTNQMKSDDGKKGENEKTAANVDPSHARVFFGRFEDFIVLATATELIFPEDDSGPGAIGLDVPYFIDKQLAGTWGINGDDYRQAPFTNLEGLKKIEKADEKVNHSRANRGKIFLEGLRLMNNESTKRFDTSFNQATEEQQHEIMSDLEAGKLDMKSIPSDAFFALLKQATLEGAFSDPLYGGNKNMDGWRMKEFAGARPSYADVIESEDFVVLDPISLTDYQRKK
ncbi:dehydrogenase [Sporosarcina sp. P26b]|nr:dehydrogenase [Sporosarcina sp. P26b]